MSRWRYKFKRYQHVDYIYISQTEQYHLGNEYGYRKKNYDLEYNVFYNLLQKKDCLELTSTAQESLCEY